MSGFTFFRSLFPSFYRKMIWSMELLVTIKFLMFLIMFPHIYVLISIIRLINNKLMQRILIRLEYFIELRYLCSSEKCFNSQLNFLSTYLDTNDGSSSQPRLTKAKINYWKETNEETSARMSSIQTKIH